MRTAVARVCSSPPPGLPHCLRWGSTGPLGQGHRNARDGGASGPSLTQAHTRAEAYQVTGVTVPTSSAPRSESTVSSSSDPRQGRACACHAEPRYRRKRDERRPHRRPGWTKRSGPRGRDRRPRAELLLWRSSTDAGPAGDLPQEAFANPSLPRLTSTMMVVRGEAVSTAVPADAAQLPSDAGLGISPGPGQLVTRKQDVPGAGGKVASRLAGVRSSFATPARSHRLQLCHRPAGPAPTAGAHGGGSCRGERTAATSRLSAYPNGPNRPAARHAPRSS